MQVPRSPPAGCAEISPVTCWCWEKHILTEKCLCEGSMLLRTQPRDCAANAHTRNSSLILTSAKAVHVSWHTGVVVSPRLDSSVDLSTTIVTPPLQTLCTNTNLQSSGRCPPAGLGALEYRVMCQWCWGTLDAVRPSPKKGLGAYSTRSCLSIIVCGARVY